MNNDEFRKLVLANSGQASRSRHGPSPPTDSQSGGGALGSRQRASIPMTPRSVAGAQVDFARQVAERTQSERKGFRTSAPKGVKLASGYVDRAQLRQNEGADDREERLKALELSLKKEEIDRETYDRLRFEIAGGSLESTHLVKGLDYKLLERARRGDDIYGNKEKEPAKDDEAADEEDVDDAFNELEGREVHAMEKAQATKKKGQLSTVPVVPGRKRTRDQILAGLKASREAAKAQQASSLGSKFKKIGVKQKPGTRIERDGKGREVLIIVDEDGHEKRKVRKLQPAEEAEEPGSDLLLPDPKAKPLGMEVPEQYRKREEAQEQDEDVDIFDGVGDDYDPLAGMDASDSDSGPDSSSEGDEAATDKGDSQPSREETAVAQRPEAASDAALMPPPPKPTARAAARNYFQDSQTGLLSERAAEGPSMSDPAMAAAIKRAAALGRAQGDGDERAKEKASRALEERRRKLLQQSARDEADIDMGFGTSRLEDEEDMDVDDKVRLSVWDGADGGGEGRGRGRGGGGQPKRKRGPKKRKGDVDSAADVLRVVEQRKKA